MFTIFFFFKILYFFSFDKPPEVLKEFPEMLSTCWLFYFHSEDQLILEFRRPFFCQDIKGYLLLQVVYVTLCTFWRVGCLETSLVDTCCYSDIIKWRSSPKSLLGMPLKNLISFAVRFIVAVIMLYSFLCDFFGYRSPEHKYMSREADWILILVSIGAFLNIK